MTPCSSEVTVNLKVMDKSMPIFDKQFYSISVAEDIEIHSHLSVTIKAESPLTRKLIYSISAGNTMEQFSVDFNTGNLRTPRFKNLRNRIIIFFSLAPVHSIMYKRKKTQ